MILSLPVLLAVACFAFANRSPVNLSLWPLDAAVELPLSFLAMGVLFAGLLSGAALAGTGAWAAIIRRNLRIRRLERELLEHRGKP